MQLLQGASTTGALRPMMDAIVAADRGYNSKETINFVSNVLGASLIGTHKRDLWFPYVFGDGPISRRHRGMVVSERGCRAIYSARLKGSACNRQMRAVEACLYRKRCSGRIAAMIHNNGFPFPSRCFTVVLKEAFRSPDSVAKVQDSLILFDGTRCDGSIMGRETPNTRFQSTGREAVENLLKKVDMLTYLQSEDPVWFLFRAFRFSSRMGHSFLSAVARNFNSHVKGLASKLAGSRITAGVGSLPVAISDAEHCIKDRWDSVINVLGMRKEAETQPNSRRALAAHMANFSSSRINSFTKSELQRILGVFERQIDSRVPKVQLVSALLQLQLDIRNEEVCLEGHNDGGARSEPDICLEAEKVCVRR